MTNHATSVNQPGPQGSEALDTRGTPELRGGTAISTLAPTALREGVVGRVQALASGAVDAVGLEARAAALGTRSIKHETKMRALHLAVRMVDLTTLEGADTPGRIESLAAKAIRPDPSDPSMASVAAVCVYPSLVPLAVKLLRHSSVAVASVATGFPSGQIPTSLKLREVEAAVGAGAEEIDMVIDRGALLSGRYGTVVEEVAQVKAACGSAHLKVILESGELGSYDVIRRASLLAIAGGADFIKTSTGKLPRSATPAVVLCMLETIRDVYQETGVRIGMKSAGGIRTAKQAISLLVLAHETLGDEWLTPDLFRIGASSLLNDLLMQIRKQRVGVYQGPDHYTLG